MEEIHRGGPGWDGVVNARNTVDVLEVNTEVIVFVLVRIGTPWDVRLGSKVVWLDIGFWFQLLTCKIALPDADEVSMCCGFVYVRAGRLCLWCWYVKGSGMGRGVAETRIVAACVIG